MGRYAGQEVWAETLEVTTSQTYRATIGVENTNCPSSCPEVPYGKEGIVTSTCLPSPSLAFAFCRTGKRSALLIRVFIPWSQTNRTCSSEKNTFCSTYGNHYVAGQWTACTQSPSTSAFSQFTYIYIYISFTLLEYESGSTTMMQKRCKQNWEWSVKKQRSVLRKENSPPTVNRLFFCRRKREVQQ